MLIFGLFSSNIVAPSICQQFQIIDYQNSIKKPLILLTFKNGSQNSKHQKKNLICPQISQSQTTVQNNKLNKPILNIFSIAQINNVQN